MDARMAEVERRPASTISRERRFGVAVSLAMIVGGGWWAASELTGEAVTRELSYPMAGTSLTVDARAADVEIRSGDVSEIKVTRHSEGNVFSSEPKERYDDGSLELTASCGFLGFGSCNTRYVIVVPREHALKVETASGNLTASDLSGTMVLKSRSGDVKVSSAGGSVTLETSSGDIVAEKMVGGSVKASASSGDVKLAFSEAPSAVVADASSGDVRIVLPPGPDAYRLDVETSSGDQQTSVRTDPASARVIKAETSSGDLKIEYADR